MIRNWKRYRWDRIAWVVALLGWGGFSLVSWVSPVPDAEAAAPVILTHPDGRGEVEWDWEAMAADASAAESQPQTPPPSTEPVAPDAPPAEEIKPCSCNRHQVKLDHNPYDNHRATARNLPNSFFIRSDRELDAGARRGRLVEVTSGRGFHIPPLSHSHPRLLPEAHQLLIEIGNAFADELEGTPSAGTRMRVTSLTRTAEQQKRLTRQNYNAIDRESTHSYGASFDIAFLDRPDNRSDCSLPTLAAQKVLERFQEAGRILVIPEGQCLHVTVRR
jgi:hypothetical protein